MITEKSTSRGGKRIKGLPSAEEAGQILDQILSTPIHRTRKTIDRPLALYGAGELGLLAKRYFDEVGIKVCFVVDANAHSMNNINAWRGIEILEPSDIDLCKKKSVIIAVCVAKEPYSNIELYLKSNGWDNVVPFYSLTEFYKDRHPLGNGWSFDKLESADIFEIIDVLNCFDDDISRAHYLQFIAWHRLEEDWIFEDAVINPDSRYFITQVTSVLSDKERVLDLGAHHGNFIDNFVKLVRGKFEKIWAVEPDDENYRLLNVYLSQLPNTLSCNIKPIRAAVGAKACNAGFYSGLGYASQLCEYGNSNVDVLSIDDLNLAPSLIKAHLEGAEMDAILNGFNTISKNKPIIILTVYHNILGLYRCAKSLMAQFNDCGYRFLFRMHSWQGTGAVLYLINRN